jgi:hypothetical protein
MKGENQIFYTISGEGNGDADSEESWDDDRIVSFNRRRYVPAKKQKQKLNIGMAEKGQNAYGLNVYQPHWKRNPETNPYPMPKKLKASTIRISGSPVVSMSQAPKGRTAFKGPKAQVKDQGAFREKGNRKKKGNGFHSLILLILVLMLAFTAGIGTGWFLWGNDRQAAVNLGAIQIPQWVKQELIRKNIYSRPAVSLRQVNDIVIHYVANPGSSAEQNRNYFDRLADQGEKGTSASAHFIIGLDGEIIQCIPIHEIAYASNNRNSDTIAIECCHPDETGKFTEATYESLVKLTAWLCDETGISRKDIIRHYDITEKNCPKYFVDHEEAWKTFRNDVKAYKGDWESR